MGRDIRLDKLFSTFIEEGIVRHKDSALFYYQNIFEDIDFQSARVLDIGGGDGKTTFFAASMGAAQVICLEPEDAGSRPGKKNTFMNIQKRLGFSEQVILEPVTFQEYVPDRKKFDVILLHNSVNHLDENACIHLLESDKALDIYRTIFSKINFLAAAGAKILVSDCSRGNIFAALGMQNPFAPTIEWHKHQTPETWISLLGEAGFQRPRVRWTSPSRLFSVGKVITGNRLAAFFLKSHFVITMEKA